MTTKYISINRICHQLKKNVNPSLNFSCRNPTDFYLINAITKKTENSASICLQDYFPLEASSAICFFTKTCDTLQ